MGTSRVRNSPGKDVKRFELLQGAKVPQTIISKFMAVQIEHFEAHHIYKVSKHSSNNLSSFTLPCQESCLLVEVVV
jgi:hypothetical protein